MVDPHRPALLAAAVLLGTALQRTDGFYSPAALGMVVAALACAWAALGAPRRLGALVPDRDDLVRALLTAAVLAQLAVILRAPIGMYFARPMPDTASRFRPRAGRGRRLRPRGVHEPAAMAPGGGSRRAGRRRAARRTHLSGLA